MSYITNKKVLSEFFISEKYSAGIELFGHEVKSIKRGLGSLIGSRCIVRGNECFVVGMYIPPYQKQNTVENYDPYRSRKLIITRKEKNVLALLETTKGTSLLPLSLYPKERIIKMDIGVGKRKDPRDKRQDIRKKIERRERGDQW